VLLEGQSARGSLVAVWLCCNSVACARYKITLCQARLALRWVMAGISTYANSDTLSSTTNEC